MKIAQIHPYPPIIQDQAPELPGDATQGGAETSSFEFARNLALRGHHVTFYAAKYPGITSNEIVISPNLKVRYFPTWFGNLGLAGSPYLFFELLKENYDVIQTHQIPMLTSVIGAIAAKLLKNKFLMTFHGRTAYCTLDWAMGWFAAKLSDYVTVQNKFGFEKIRTMVSESKIVYLPHGINTDWLQTTEKPLIEVPKDKTIILYVGRLQKPKGVHFLISALSELPRNKYCLVVVGDGPEKENLKNQSLQMGVNKQVIFTGQLNQKSIAPYSQRAHIYVLAATDMDDQGSKLNVSENFGNSLVEAMVARVPVISSRVGGVPEWITDGKNGLLFDQRDVDQLVERIVKLGDNQKLRNMIVDEASKDVAKNYTWDSISEKFEALYQS